MADQPSIVFPTIDLAPLVVPWDECISVDVGPVPEDHVRELEQRDFDQAPVFAPTDHGRAFLGLIARSDLTELAFQGQSLEADDPRVRNSPDIWLYSGTNLDTVLSKMAEHAAVVVMQHYDGGGEVQEYDASLGLLTRSDLNKHPLRVIIYDILADLEVRLAELVRRSFPGHRDWIGCLNEDSQARILGYWELSKLRGVDTGPVASATLTELLRVVATDEPTRQRIGYPSRKAFDADTGRIPGVRNQVMHPVRPLITDAQSCRGLEETLGSALLLVKRLKPLRKRKG